MNATEAKKPAAPAKKALDATAFMSKPLVPGARVEKGQNWSHLSHDQRRHWFESLKAVIKKRNMSKMVVAQGMT